MEFDSVSKYISMAHLIIRNIGPIKKVDFDLNKVNVFMGPQSSGKSTIAKIVSYCAWLEKRISLEQSYEKYVKDNFVKNLVSFHKMEGYIREDSYLKYESDVYQVIYKGLDSSPEFKLKDTRWDYKQEKIAYIPAERNIISVLPQWSSIKMPDNSTANFMEDWGNMRELFTVDRPLDLLSLGIKYYYDKPSNKDFIQLLDGTKIQLFSSSSGVQSVVPLLLLCHTLLNDSLREELDSHISFDNKVVYEQLKETIYRNRFHYSTIRSYPGEIPVSESYREGEGENGHFRIFRPGEKDLFYSTVDNFTKTQFCNLIIEEPEENLFPDTQQDFVYHIIHEILRKEGHKLLITTHSPFVLFALNNCLMGKLVEKNIPADRKKEYPSFTSWIDPKMVSIYEIHDGELKCIQDKDGILEDNYLNRAYKENSTEYLSLLNYYEDEE